MTHDHSPEKDAGVSNCMAVSSTTRVILSKQGAYPIRTLPRLQATVTQSHQHVVLMNNLQNPQPRRQAKQRVSFSPWR
jgi:hypothetical protein